MKAEPEKAEASVHARLLGRNVVPETVQRFADSFSKQTQSWLEGPTQRARQLAQAGRFQSALAQYREALLRQPFSWPLMNEVAHFLTFVLGNAAAGLEMARTALEHNPGCSPDLWNMLGDCLFELGRRDESRRAFERALAISPDDVRARYNLAFVHVASGEYQEALLRLAEGLGRDRTGAFRDRLLQKQVEVLTLLEQQNRRRYLGQADRVAGTAGLPREPGGAALARPIGTGGTVGRSSE